MMKELNLEETRLLKPTRDIVRLLDSFEFKNHLCLVFELMSINLFELIKLRQFRGLKMDQVRAFTAQITDALIVLESLGIVHCDVKPENVLMCNFCEPPRVKLVDLGSACKENSTVYTYIQSRFYRAPEVILGLPYSMPIDMWSLGCMAVELYMGLPIFPGVSEHNQLCRVVEMLGPIPDDMIREGKNTKKFFKAYERADSPMSSSSNEGMYSLPRFFKL